MLANYVKIALRVLRKDSTFTLINVGGLAAGLAIALLIIQYVRFELSYENTYPLANRLVRITTDYLNGGAVDSQDAEMYPLVGGKAKQTMPEVVDFARVHPFDEKTTVQIGDSYHLIDRVYGVDPSFFSLFGYPLLRGNSRGLFTRPRQAVLTESMALTYFNTLDVLGKPVKIPGPSGPVLLEIVGVMPNNPPNTHLKVNMLVSYPTMLSDFGKKDNWNNNNTYTYLLLAKKTSYADFSRSLAAFSNRVLRENKVANERVVSEPIADIHLYSHKTFEPGPNGEARSVYLLLGVAVLVLLSALVNYVNLTTAKALDRAREMGVRKVAGSTRKQIRMQVFTETALINVAAGIGAVGLVALLQPLFSQMTDLPKGFNVLGDAFFWASVAGFLLLSIGLSGVYPAFVLSSFEPVLVLKGTFSRSAKGALLRKSLVVFQFAATLVLLVQTFAVYQQVAFLREQNLGVSIDQTIVVRAPATRATSPQYSAFQQQLLAQAQVKGVSISGTVPGLGSTQLAASTGINLSDAPKKTYYNYFLTQIDTSFIDLMGLRLLAGRNFDASTRSGFIDTTDRQLIVNEETLRLWEIPSPAAAIGRRVDLWGHQATIRGVVANYHYESPKAAYIPIIHMYWPQFNSFASVKFAGGKADEQLAILKKVYEANFPHSPFSYFFMDSEYDKQYKADDRFRQVFGVLTAFAVLISGLGLFGLATFTVAKRTKEIGIRKVIGASTANLVLLLSTDFIRTVLLAILIGLPITYLLVNQWLVGYAVRVPLNWWLFAGPTLAVVLLVLVVIGGKTVATALMNPVKSLRSE